MLYIYVGVAAMLIFGGILVYCLGIAYTSLSTTVVALNPTLATDQGVIFLGSIWYWFVLFIIIAAFIFVIVNSQRRENQYA